MFLQNRGKIRVYRNVPSVICQPNHDLYIVQQRKGDFLRALTSHFLSRPRPHREHCIHNRQALSPNSLGGVFQRTPGREN